MRLILRHLASHNFFKIGVSDQKKGGCYLHSHASADERDSAGGEDISSRAQGQKICEQGRAKQQGSEADQRIRARSNSFNHLHCRVRSDAPEGLGIFADVNQQRARGENDAALKAAARRELSVQADIETEDHRQHKRGKSDGAHRIA